MLFFIAAFFLFIFLFQMWVCAWIFWWKYMPVQSTTFMRSELGRLQEKNSTAELKHLWVPYSQISVHLKRAVIAAEDANFPDHEGVDWEAIEAAHAKNKKRGKVVAGGSTITMQLAKNLFLSSQRSYIRKAEELVITYLLETILDKQRILEIYLNSVEWGIGVFGAQAAAQHYFGTTAAKLSPSEAARLAAMLPRPKFYDKNRRSGFLAKRSSAIERFMADVDEP
ncbi:MAG: monofunctional biosynthetic peptidoglycan transglycosylase [Burkholderiaceae bacterium]|nr:monofunctional biosynthetic peptidoglycan transglycosylase [Burkholderiaceae bacterium]